MENKVFFPQSALDEWMVDEKVDFRDGVLTILGEGRRYKLEEGVRVLREVTGAADVHDLIGRVKSRAALEAMGAEIVESSMLLGDGAYDVEAGWFGPPIGSFSEHDRSDGRKKARAAAAATTLSRTDEELLFRFLGGP